MPLRLAARDQALIELVEHAPVPFVMTDRQTRRTLATNAAWRKLVELPDGAQDVDVTALVEPAQLEALAALATRDGGVRDVGGEVSLSSAPGRGSTFVATLLLDAAEAPPPRARPA